MDKELLLGKYRHYKGGVYNVIAIGKHSETKEDMVVYQSVEDSKVWLRPFDMFFEDIELESKTLPRFQKINNQL